MKTLLVALLAGGALVGVTSSAVGAAGTTHRLLGVVGHTAHPGAPAAGAAKATATVNFNCIAACSDYESTINQYFTDVAAASGATDNVYSVMTQYYAQTPATHYITYDQTFGGSYVDSNSFPASGGCNDGKDAFCVTDGQIQTEMQKVIAANRWPTGSTDLFVIFTPANVGICQSAGNASDSNPCTTNFFCAYHSWTADDVIYAVEPDAAAIPGGGCDNSFQTPAGNSADDTINSISHEQIEAITDPVGTAWTANDAYGDEIADLCSGDYGTPLGGLPGAFYNQVINGHDYFLQLEYSNADHGCVPSLGGAVTAPDPLLDDGRGPVAYHHAGPVMLTNTVYAIYWVPTVPTSAPSNTVPPAIAGTTKVGKRLLALHGSWTPVATRFAYRWLRCSPAGTSCKSIPRATKAMYKLRKADAKHKLEVRVTAANAAGTTRVKSAPTKRVKP